MGAFFGHMQLNLTRGLTELLMCLSGNHWPQELEKMAILSEISQDPNAVIHGLTVKGLELSMTNSLPQKCLMKSHDRGWEELKKNLFASR